jgi:RNA polymerase sigma-70 factor, ECF subfamily
LGTIRRLWKSIVEFKPLEPDHSRTDANFDDLTRLLVNWSASSPEEKARVIQLMYPELKRVAEMRMSRERRDHTLQPTALVNEFFLRLAKSRSIGWQSRAHFLAAASRAMRLLLVDYSRSHNAGKRGGDQAANMEIEGGEPAQAPRVVDIMEIDELLTALAAEEPRMASVVEMRCFGGLTHAEIAEVLGVDERTVKRDWQVARAWMFNRLRGGSPDVGRGMGAG